MFSPTQMGQIYLIFNQLPFLWDTSDTIRFFNGTPIQPMPPLKDFEGAGVYALYFIGKKGVYQNFHEINRLEYRQPIYIGKAVPRGWRQGRIPTSSSQELYR